MKFETTLFYALAVLWGIYGTINIVRDTQLNEILGVLSYMLAMMVLNYADKKYNENKNIKSR